MPISDKVQRILDKFSSATIRAAMAENPSVMTASGWRMDNSGKPVQDNMEDPGVKSLQESLSTIASIPYTDIAGEFVGALPFVQRGFGAARSFVLRNSPYGKRMTNRIQTALSKIPEVLREEDKAYVNPGLKQYLIDEGINPKILTDTALEKLTRARQLSIEKASGTSPGRFVMRMAPGEEGYQFYTAYQPGFPKMRESWPENAVGYIGTEPLQNGDTAIQMVENVTRRAYPNPEAKGVSESLMNAVIQDKGHVVSGRQLLHPEITTHVWEKYPNKQMLGNFGKWQSSGRSFIYDKPVYKLLSPSYEIPLKYGDMFSPKVIDDAGNFIVDFNKGPMFSSGGLLNDYKSGGRIHIKKSKRGTFTAAAKKHGKSVQAFASQVLANKGNYSPAMVKKANFARNSAKWHAAGGLLHTYGDGTPGQITLDEFMKQKADSVRNAAHAMSLFRENTKDPIVYVDTDQIIKEYEQGIRDAETRYSQESARVQLPIPGHNIAESEASLLNARYPIDYGRGTMKYLDTLANLEQYRSDWYDHLPFTPVDEKLRELGEGVLDNYKAEVDMQNYGELLAGVMNGPKVIEVNGANCISTASDNYGKGHWVTGNQSFAADPAQYGFKKISVADIQPGDIVQNYNRTHGMVFNRIDDEGIPRFNYAAGAPGELRKDAVYSRTDPFTDEYYHAYRFVGNEADRKKWEREFNGKASGGPLDTLLKWFRGKPAVEAASFAPVVVDYSGLKTTNNRKYNPKYISYISDSLKNSGISDIKRASILANIIEESGGNPFALDSTGKFYGLLQWAGDRYAPTKEKDVYKEIDNQLKYITDTIGNSTDKKSWTHGGTGSGYNSLKDAMTDFDSDDLDTAMKGFTLGYVRPTGKIDSYNNRLKVAKQLYDLKGFRPFDAGGMLNKYGPDKLREALKKIKQS